MCLCWLWGKLSPKPPLTTNYYFVEGVCTPVQEGPMGSGNGQNGGARDHNLVVLQLAGGNDYLNTIVPYENHGFRILGTPTWRIWTGLGARQPGITDRRN